MTEKRFILDDDGIIVDMVDLSIYMDNEDCCEKLNELSEENEQLKQDIENLIVTIKAREALIDVCEKKFKELGYIITVNDDGYVIE